MTTAHRTTAPAPPPRETGPIVRGSQAIQHWLTYYWQKLQLPAQELSRLAITQDRQEYMRWTGKRLHLMVLGCYCYLPAPPTPHTPHTLHAQARPNTRSRQPSQAQSFPIFEDT